ncbi:MAG: NRDE family protein [Pseudomonadota bacterium]
MCLVVFAVAPDARTTLLLAGNRDEFHERPSGALAAWDDFDGVVGGRDLQAGGTWLAAKRGGRFATVTNSRDAVPPSPQHRSRGFLVTEFLGSSLSALQWLEQLDGAAYAGFNLVVSDGDSVAYGSNRVESPRLLTPGLYAVSNAVLDTPWHKVRYATEALRGLLERGQPNDDALFDLLHSDRRAQLDEVPSSDLDPEFAHQLTAPFIVNERYGTRCTTVVRLHRDGGIDLNERRFTPTGERAGDSRMSI